MSPDCAKVEKLQYQIKIYRELAICENVSTDKGHTVTHWASNYSQAMQIALRINSIMNSSKRENTCNPFGHRAGRLRVVV